MKIIEAIEKAFENNIEKGISLDSANCFKKIAITKMNEYLEKGYKDEYIKYVIYSNINKLELTEEIKKKMLSSIQNWKQISKSPFSNSFYNSNDISWDYKPENSFRLSDHWNFESQGQKHCELSVTTEYVSKWMLCQFKNGKYEIIEEF